MEQSAQKRWISLRDDGLALGRENYRGMEGRMLMALQRSVSRSRRTDECGDAGRCWWVRGNPGNGLVLVVPLVMKSDFNWPIVDCSSASDDRAVSHVGPMSDTIHMITLRSQSHYSYLKITVSA